MEDQTPLTKEQILDLASKVMRRARRIQESNQNPSQETLDALADAAADLYHAINEMK
jgi:L-serine deaminase